MPLFDCYVIVDWSASNRSVTGRDSIWLCVAMNDGTLLTSNIATRRKAEAAIADIVLAAVKENKRVFVGCDFSYGYPAGFADALGLTGTPWRAVWEYLAGRLTDSETNENNRFVVAAGCNERLMRHVFWGRPIRDDLPWLSRRRDLVEYRQLTDGSGLSEWRYVEALLRAQGRQPHSTWKLFGAGAVGGQSLTGIPVISRLRSHRELVEHSMVWPYEVIVPELACGKPAVVYGEVWPSLFAVPHVAGEVWPSLFAVPHVAGEVRDRAQVIHCATELLRLDRKGALEELLAVPGEVPVAKEEGWILGVA